MSQDKFTRLVRALPSFYKGETNVLVRGLLKAWGLSDDNIDIQIQETKNQLFVETAENNNLDALGTNVGVPRTPGLGIEDKDFRKLIPVLSYFPKQVRATVIALLDVFFGEGFTRPNISSGNTETFDFGPVTTLSGTLTFQKGSNSVTGLGTQFGLEVPVGSYIKAVSADGEFYAKVTNVIDDLNLELTLPYEGPFALNTQATKADVRELSYTVDKSISKTIRFIPNAFSDIINVTVEELVDFINNSTEHNALITASSFIDPLSGNKLNIRSNTAGLRGSIKINGGDANDASRLNFDQNEITDTRAAVYELNPNEIVIRIPSSVPVLRRSLRGSAHPKQTKVTNTSVEGVFDFSTLGATSTLDIEVDGNTYNLTFNHATDFPDSTKVTVDQVAAALDLKIAVLEARSKTNNSTTLVELRTTAGSGEFTVIGGTANTLLQFSTATFTDPDVIIEEYPSAYVFDPTGQLYTVTGISSELSRKIDVGSISTDIALDDASVFPNSSGQILINFGRSGQEGPIRYNSRPNNSSLLIDASHIFANDHDIGRKVNFVSDSPTVPRLTGDDYPVFVVGTESARQGAEDIIRSILASGVVIRFIIDFPEFLFSCTASACCDDLGSTDHVGSRSAEEPFTF